MKTVYVAINPWKPVNRSYIYCLRMHPTVVTLELDAITNKIRKLWMTLYCLLLQPLCLYDCNTGVVSRTRPLRVRIRGAAKPHPQNGPHPGDFSCTKACRVWLDSWLEHRYYSYSIYGLSEWQSVKCRIAGCCISVVLTFAIALLAGLCRSICSEHPMVCLACRGLQRWVWLDSSARWLVLSLSE